MTTRFTRRKTSRHTRWSYTRSMRHGSWSWRMNKLPSHRSLQDSFCPTSNPSVVDWMQSTSSHSKMRCKTTTQIVRESLSTSTQLRPLRRNRSVELEITRSQTRPCSSSQRTQCWKQAPIHALLTSGRTSTRPQIHGMHGRRRIKP